MKIFVIIFIYLINGFNLQKPDVSEDWSEYAELWWSNKSWVYPLQNLNNLRWVIF